MFCRTLEHKTEQIINTLFTRTGPSEGGAVPAEGAAVPAGIKEELLAFKNTQSLVQHQLQDLRYVCSYKKTFLGIFSTVGNGYNIW